MKHPKNLFNSTLRWLAVLSILTGICLPPLAAPVTAQAHAQAALPIASLPSSWNWQFSDLGLVFDGGNLDVLLNDNNQPIAVFNDGDSLYSAVLQGAAWQITPVLTQKLDNLNAARDIAGSLYLTGHDPAKTLPVYVRSEDTQWYTETISTTAPTGYTPNLALNGEDAWVVYTDDPFNGTLIAAQRTPTGWETQTITQNAGEAALAFDPNGLPHIVYCHAVGQVCAGLTHTWYENSEWFTESVTSTVFTGYEPDFVIDNSGVMHAVFYDMLNGDLYYAVSTGGTWQIEAVDTTGDMGRAPTLAVAPDGRVHIAYQDVTNQRLRYALQTDSGWAIEDVGFSNGLYHALAVDALGRPHLLWWNQADVLLEYAVGERLPDLTVTSLMWQGSQLTAQVQNIGLAAGGSGARLTIARGAALLGEVFLTADLAPNERISLTLPNAYTCAPPQDSLTVTIDAENSIAEADEDNNQLERNWVCDTAAPRFTTHPTGSSISTVSAVVSWETDEPTTGQLFWGTNRTNLQTIHSDTLGLVHQVTLSGLSPATAYLMYVDVQDASGNSTRSRVSRFSTQAQAGAPPSAPTFALKRVPGVQERYQVQAQFTLPQGIERVDFTVNGVAVGSDYSASEDGRFDVEILPFWVAATRPGFFANPLEVLATAHTASGGVFSFPVGLQPIPEDMPMSAIFTAPTEWSRVFSVLPVPGDTYETFEVWAEEFEWQCSWNPSAGEQDCNAVGSAVQRVEWFFDDVYIGTSYPDNANDWFFSMNINLKGRTAGAYFVKAVAYANDGGVSTLYHLYEVRQGVFDVRMSRSVFRSENRFLVTLTVRNAPESAGDIELDTVTDWLEGFFAYNATETNYRVTSQFSRSVTNNQVTFRGNAVVIDAITGNGKTLRPGESVTFAYNVLPILFDATQFYRFGVYATQVKFKPVGGTTQVLNKSVGTPQIMSGGQSVSVPQAVAQAFGVSDYILVTNPDALFRQMGNIPDTSGVLSDMARLASVRNGVLAYSTLTDGGYVLDDLLEYDGAWAQQMHPNFRTVGGGYVLLVGETEVIPAFESPHFDLNWDGGGPNHTNYTDHGYSNAYHGGSVPGRPELVLGRIVGNTAWQLRSALQTAYAHAVGTSGYQFDNSGALIVVGDGSHSGRFYDAADSLENKFRNDGMAVNRIDWVETAYLGALPITYDKYDGFTAGDLDNDGSDELIIVGDNANQVTILAQNSAVLGTFPFPWADYDLITTGNLDADAADEILIADVSADKLWGLDGVSGAPLTGYPLDVPLRSGYSALAVGNVTYSNVGREIVVGDWWNNRLYIYDIYGNLLMNLKLSDLGLPTRQQWSPMVLADVVGDSLYEIIIGDMQGKRLIIVHDELEQAATVDFNFQHFTGLSHFLSLDAGQMGYSNKGSKREIVVSYANTVYSAVVQVYGFVQGDVQRFELYRNIPQTHGMHRFEPVILARSPGATDDVQLYRASTANAITKLDHVFPQNAYNLGAGYAAQDADYLVYFGHGSAGGWNYPDVYAYPPEYGSLPVAVGFTCLSGQYEGNNDNSLAEKFISESGGVFLGSTEISSIDHNNEATLKFFERYTASGKSIGNSFLDLKRNRYNAGGAFDNDMWKFWVYEYHLYGDPKFGSGDSLTQAHAPMQMTAPTEIEIQLPPLDITVTNGIHTLALPGGETYLQTGEYRVPLWEATYTYPAGTVIQDVLLQTQDQMTLTQGILLDQTALYHSLSSTPPQKTWAQIVQAQRTAPDDWLPNFEQPYAWSASQNPDGTVTLSLRLYPVTYNPAAASVRSYRHYTLQVQTSLSDFSISTLDLDTNHYLPNQPLTFTAHISSSVAQDVYLTTYIEDESGTLQAARAEQMLANVSGSAVYDAVWAHDLPNGQYTLFAALYDTSGNLLAVRGAPFTVGSAHATVTDLQVSSATFTPGDLLTLSAILQNTGSAPITGTLIVQVMYSETLSTTQTFTHTFSSLAVGQTLNVDALWDTTGIPAGEYLVRAYVNYAASTSNEQIRVISTVQPPLDEYKIYLPLVRR